MDAFALEDVGSRPHHRHWQPHRKATPCMESLLFLNILAGPPCPTLRQLPTWWPLNAFSDSSLRLPYAIAPCLVLRIHMIVSPQIQTDVFQQRYCGPMCSFFGFFFPSARTSVLPAKATVNYGSNIHGAPTFDANTVHRMHLFRTPIHPWTHFLSSFQTFPIHPRRWSVAYHRQARMFVPSTHPCCTNFLRNDVETQPSFPFPTCFANV